MVKLKYYGHSAFEINYGGKRLFLDPFIVDNPLNNIKSVDEYLGEGIDYVLITHGHWDHIGDAIELAKRGSKIISIYEVVNYIASKSGNEGIISTNIGGTVHLDNNIKVTVLPASHSSSIPKENGEFIYLGNPTSLLLNLGGIKIYHLGDTGLIYDFKWIGKMYKPDIVLLPIGSTFTMDIYQAKKALEFLKPKVAIPMHYNTWPPIEVDPNKFKGLVEEDNSLNVKVKIMKVMEEIDVEKLFD